MERWVEALRWSALAVWIAIPVGALVVPPLAGHLVWTVIVAGLASLEPEALDELAASSTDSHYAPGQALCIEGDPGDEVFVLMAGTAAVVAGATRDGAVLRSEPTGSVIGEMAVLEAAPRSASVFAGVEGARVLRLNGAAFHAILDVDPAVADGVIRTLARRMRTREVAEATSN